LCTKGVPSKATAFQISKRIKMPRATIYFTLEILKEKRLVSQSRRNNVLYFYAESPNRLIDSLKEKVNVAEAMIPEISLLRTNNVTNPRSTVYIGIDNVKNAWEDIIETLKDSDDKQLFAISSSKVYEHYPKYFEKWLKKREDAKIYTRLIGPQLDNKNEEMKSNSLREVRYVSDDFPFESPINIYGDKVAFFAYKEKALYTIVIESKTVSANLRKIFMYIWNSLPKSNQ
jgi:sugar-specific transcriptional regulator TrmB